MDDRTRTFVALMRALELSSSHADLAYRMRTAQHVRRARKNSLSLAVKRAPHRTWIIIIYTPTNMGSFGAHYGINIRIIFRNYSARLLDTPIGAIGGPGEQRLFDLRFLSLSPSGELREDTYETALEIGRKEEQREMQGFTGDC